MMPRTWTWSSMNMARRRLQRMTHNLTEAGDNTPAHILILKHVFFLNMESKTCELICVGSIAQLLFWLGVADDYNHISHYFSNYFSILHSAQSVARWTYDSLWLNALAGLGGMQTVGTFQLWIQNWFFCACSSSRLMLVARHQCLSQTSCAMDRLEKNWTSAASTKNNMFGTVDDWVPQS